jgi:AcrR family transcriptional regulator
MDAKVALANKLFADKSVDLDDICATLKISKTTLYRYVEIATGRVIRSRNHPR